MGSPNRRRKRRSDRTSEPTDTFDLRELLEEQAVPSTPEAWFEARWNIGLNAIRLGIDLVEETMTDPSTTEAITAIRKLIEGERIFTDALYWPAQDMKDEFRALKDGEIVIGPLDMIQKLSARSDGGGEVYNQILLRMCNVFLASGGGADKIEPIVRRWRARDFVKLVPDQAEPGDPATQKRIRTFEHFWQKRLFRFAFCVS
jgi:hypothetical protein